MIHVRLGRFSRIVLVGLLLNGSSVKAEEVAISLVQELPRSESHAGVLVHADRLWLSMSSEVEGKFGTVEIYDRDGQTKLASVDVGHTPGFIHPYGESSVLVVGKSLWPWKSHATVITKTGQSYSKKTTTFSESYLVNAFAGNPATQFFTEPGNSTVYRYQNGKMRPVINPISGPGDMVLAGKKLWVIESRSFSQGDESLVIYDIESGKTQRIFADAYRNGLTQLAYNSRNNLIAVTESAQNAVILLDAKTGAVVDTVAVNEFPKGVVAYGQCFAITGEENKKVTFLRPSTTGTHVAGEWDVNAAGEILKKPRFMSVNSDNGELFLRSAYPCPSCLPNTQSSVVKVSGASQLAFKACFP